jgi:hypothetical protein
MLEWSKNSAVEIAAPAPLSQRGQALARGCLSPAECLELFLTERLYGDAVRFLAFGLPQRRAIWWGCLCVRQAAPSLPEDQERALKAAARWAQEPGEPRRKAAEEALGDDPLNTSAGCVAFAVAVTGPRIPFPGMPPAAPQPQLVPRIINGGVLGAAKPISLVRPFVALGIHVLHGRHLWDSVEN